MVQCTFFLVRAARNFSTDSNEAFGELSSAHGHEKAHEGSAEFLASGEIVFPQRLHERGDDSILLEGRTVDGSSLEESAGHLDSVS